MRNQETKIMRIHVDADADPQHWVQAHQIAKLQVQVLENKAGHKTELE
jgi:hypothetical protein